MRRIITRLKRPLALVLLASWAAGCSFKIPGEAKLGATSRFQEPPPVERETVGDMEWGLALSGGGLRAALFSMGVLKGLHDSELMDSVQVISSVSGGGYTAYWLYTRENARGFAGDFGDNTFPDDVFKVAMCEVLVRGNFYSYGAMARTLLKGNSFADGYNYSLLRTFGQAVHTPDTRTTGVIKEAYKLHLHDLRKAVRERDMPYFIVNATLVNPRPESGWAGGLYEFTPLHSGNERYGYHVWGDTSLELRQAIAMSGAAFRPLLKRTIPNPHYTLGQPRHLTLSDGGNSENLAAIALVRRRVKNIVIVDAEQDPRYEFKGYGILQDRLRSWGYALAVPSIDHRIRGERLPTGTHVGLVRSMVPGDTFSANIYYVKLSLPASLDAVISDPQAYARGAEDRARIFAALRNGPRVRPRDWNCDNLSGVDVNLRDWFVHQVRVYSTFRPRSSQFPQYSTLDQSYYLDQSEAFIGLGYFHAMELNSVVRGR